MVQFNLKKKITTGNGPVLLDINVSLGVGEFVSIFGASGAGKSTILRMLAGLAVPDAGSISVDDAVWFDSTRNINVLPQRRSIGFVFQEYNLFPHMTLRENLQFAFDGKEDSQVIDDFLNIACLTEVQGFKPQKLSGGQKQRAALIRALIRKPKLLLLDEPFSALDLPMRFTLQQEILKIHERFKIPTILVTHDAADIARLSKRVLILQEGVLHEESQGLQIPKQL